jgi:hypothetical protein
MTGPVPMDNDTLLFHRRSEPHRPRVMRSGARRRPLAMALVPTVLDVRPRERAPIEVARYDAVRVPSWERPVNTVLAHLESSVRVSGGRAGPGIALVQRA